MTKAQVTKLRPGVIQLVESWEVLFRPYKTCLERSGGIDTMMTEIGNALYYPEAPTWRDEVTLVGHFNREIRFSLEPEAMTFKPMTREAFQDWVMQTMAEMGYEGWSVVDRVVTAQADG